MPIAMFQAQAARGQTTGRSAAAERHRHLWTLPLRFVQELEKWIERGAQRTALRELAEQNGHLLKDIGKSRADALREAAKPFWQP